MDAATRNLLGIQDFLMGKLLGEEIRTSIYRLLPVGTVSE
jgi:hypothetical protein